MNFLSIVAFILGNIVIFLGLYLASSNMSIFLDYPSLFIVIGGTTSAIGISFQLNKTFTLFINFAKRFIFNHKVNFSSVVENLVKVINDIKTSGKINSHIEKIEDHFLKEGLQFIDESIIEKSEIIKIMNLRKSKIYSEYLDESNKIKAMAKYPPAFGMIGTTIGMVVLLANLGGEDAMKMIGPAMGVCILTTLYGTVIANLFFLPLADNLTENAQDIKKKNELNIKALELISNGTNPIIAAETLNSYLLPATRVDWKKAIGK